MSRHQPPALANLLLRCCLPPEEAEAIAGDLEEMLASSAPLRQGWRASIWYWRQVVSIVGARALAPEPATDHPYPKRPMMSAVRQDLSYAFRALRRQPGFTALAVAMLAVGIGATVAIFSLTFAVLYKPLPYRDPSRLMLLHLLSPERDAPGVLEQTIWSYPKYLVFRDHQEAFESTSTFSAVNWNLTGAGSPEQVPGELVEAAYLPLLGVAPHLGRAFSPEETRTAGSPRLVMIGYGFWLNHFGKDRTAVGRSIGLNGVPHTIIGVLPDGFRGLTGQSQLWVPITTLAASELDEKWNHSYWVVARRRADVSAAQADDITRRAGAVVSREIGDADGPARVPWSATAVPLDDQRVDPLIRRSVLLLLAAVGSVLLIVCINLANLMLVRGLGRTREVAIRSALGASRFRLIRQLMAESVVLAVSGGLAGLLVAYAALSAGAALMPDLRMVLPRDHTAGLTRIGLGLIGLDAASLLAAIGLTVLAALLFGLGPAWRASRRDLTVNMKAHAAGALARGSRGASLRNLLVVGELAIALVLLAAGGLMMKSVVRLQHTELGFNPDSLLTVRMQLPAPQYNSVRATQLVIGLLDRVRQDPAVGAAAFSTCAPISGGCNRTSASFPGQPVPDSAAEPVIGVIWASPRFFETMGIRLVRGRLFSDGDRAGQPKVVVINETAARTYWKDADPIGRKIALGQGGFGGDGAEVVGIVADVRYGAVEKTVSPDAYLPLLQSPRPFGVLFIRTHARPETVVPGLRAHVQALDPNLPLIDVKMMDTRFGEATWRQRSSASLLGIFAVLALLLAATGIYAVMSQGVEQRRREIGVRLALGAARGDILRLVIGRVLAIGIAGLAVGALVALPSMQLLRALLYQVAPGDPVVFLTLGVVLLGVTLLAGYIPARRATRVDPMVALRE